MIYWTKETGWVNTDKKAIFPEEKFRGKKNPSVNRPKHIIMEDPQLKE